MSTAKAGERRSSGSGRHTPSQKRWLKEHFSDPYVKMAHAGGLRSRAGFKLQELQERYRLLRPGQTVVDLGAAPGGWSEYAVKCVGKSGRVVALDIRQMEPPAGVEFVLGDFREAETAARLCGLLPDGADAVLSDMAPNLSGNTVIDQPRAMLLCDLAFELCCRILRPGGLLVVKVFTGSGTDEFIAGLKRHFGSLRVRKPPASRARSREVYAVATGFVPPAPQPGEDLAPPDGQDMEPGSGQTQETASGNQEMPGANGQ